MKIKKYIYVGKVSTDDGKVYNFEDIWVQDKGEAVDELKKRFCSFKLISITKSELSYRFINQLQGQLAKTGTIQ